MNWLSGLLIGLQEIREHKFRSFLTMLGVILGVASLLAMFALTSGIAALPSPRHTAYVPRSPWCHLGVAGRAHR